jgi:hypothetical protein
MAVVSSSECPNQTPCGNFGSSSGYSLHLLGASGACREVCAAGTTLTMYLSKFKFTCGTCPPPSPPPTCSGQVPCKDFGNGYYGYSLYQVDADGICWQHCAGNTNLTKLLAANYTCGLCPPVLTTTLPSCPGQKPCENSFNSGGMGYSVIQRVGNKCSEYCASSTQLTRLLASGYTCGKCPLLSCPNQEPCNSVDDGVLGSTVMRVLRSHCIEYCVAGTALTNLVASGYKCGKCPDPICPSQVPCSDSGDGQVGYFVKLVGNDGSCKETCAADSFLSGLLLSAYVCGKCPPPAPTCSGQEPCRDYGNGLLGYSVFLTTSSGNSCIEWCSTAAKLKELINTGYKCGKCPEL